MSDEGLVTLTITAERAGKRSTTSSSVPQDAADAILTAARKQPWFVSGHVALSEAATEDHFYGAWKGGSKASGGGPVPANPVKGALRNVRGQQSNTRWDPGSGVARNGHMHMMESLGLTPGTKPNTADIVHIPAGSPTAKKYGYDWDRTHVYYRGPDGDVAGMVQVQHPPGGKPYIASVTVDPYYRGKGIGMAMYDYAQDHGVDLIGSVGQGRSFTKAGKAFATRWLEHRLAMEARA